MVSISIKADVDRAARKLNDVGRKQIPFAARLTVNKLARTTREEVMNDMASKIERPTRFALRSIRAENSTRANMTARVRVDNKFNQDDIFRHLFTGGARRIKPYERLLIKIGILPAGMFTVPGAGAPIDTYGNMRRAWLKKLIGILRAAKLKGGESSLPPGVWRRKLDRKQKAIKKERGQEVGGYEYFVVHKQIQSSGQSRKGKKRLPPEPLILFITQPKYARMFDMPATASNVVSRDLQAEFNRAFELAMRTAR